MDHISKNLFPNPLYSIYYDNMVVMPQCQCVVTLRANEAKKAFHYYEEKKPIGFILKKYKYEHSIIGCYAHIHECNILSENIVQLNIKGIARFHAINPMLKRLEAPKKIIPNYSFFSDHNFDNESVHHITDLSPIIASSLNDIYSMFGEEEKTEDMVMTTTALNKIINSLIMIMPLRDIERQYLAELDSFQERHDALSLFLHPENGNIHC